MLNNVETVSLCLRIEEVAKMCGVSINTARVLINQKGFPKIKVGRRILIPKEAFIQWLNGRVVAGR